MEVLRITTTRKQEMLDITPHLRELVKEKGWREGILFLFCPHTTGGIAINENYDPTVKDDILNKLEELVPSKGQYLHREGNAHAHIKSCLVGIQQAVFVHNGELALGTWQGVFFCEWDGPRQRQIWVKFHEDNRGKPEGV